MLLMKMMNHLSENKKILNLKTHIDKIVEEGKWDMEDIFEDSDFRDDSTFNCVVYYLAG